MIFVDNDELDMEGYVNKHAPNILVAPLKKDSKRLEYLEQRCLMGEFKGVNTFLNYLLQDMPTARYDGSSAYDGTCNGFFFFESYGKAVDTFLKDPQSVRKFTEKDEGLTGGDAAGLQVAYDVTGDFLDIGRHLEGEPEAFGSMTAGNPRGRRVQIIVNLSWWSEIQESTINARCSRIARLIDWLESQQIRCRVVVIESTAMSHLEIIVKDFDEVLDINDIAVVSHSDFFRRGIFRFKEWSATPQWGYGSPRAFSEEVGIQDFLPEYNSEYSVLIDSQVTGTSRINKDFDDLEKWLSEKLADDTLMPEERVMMALR